jgi:hypothetical protein
MAETINRKGMIILISDLLDDPEETIAGLQHFRFKGHDMIVFHILDNAELTFPFDRATKFLDMEGPAELLTMPEMVKETYMNNLNTHIEAFKKGCGRLQIDYQILDTSKPLDFALFSYLSHRSKLG